MEKNDPNMKLVGRQATNQDPNAAFTAVSAMLQANPDLAALWIPEAGSAEGAVAAVKAAGDTLMIIHADITPTTLEEIRAGNIHMALNPNQGVQGFLAFMNTFLGARPELIDPFNDYKVSGFNPMTLPYSDNGFAVITKDNADSFVLETYMEGRSCGRFALPEPTTFTPPAPLLQQTDLAKTFGAVRALRSAQFELLAGRHPCIGRREWRGQVHADEHHRRHPFLTWTNMRAMTMAFSVEAVVVVGMTILLILGGIDLSVGSVTALAMVIAGLLFLNGVNPWIASLTAVAACAGIGAIMGVFVTHVGLRHFIVTLAAMVIARGLCLLGIGGRPPGLFDLPESFKWIEIGSIGVVPLAIVIVVLVVAVFDFVLRRTTVFRLVDYTGSNEKAAAYSGIRTKQVIFLTTVLCSTLCGAAGIIYMARFGSAQPTFGVGMN